MTCSDLLTTLLQAWLILAALGMAEAGSANMIRSASSYVVKTCCAAPPLYLNFFAAARFFFPTMAQSFVYLVGGRDFLGQVFVRDDARWSKAEPGNIARECM